MQLVLLLGTCTTVLYNNSTGVSLVLDKNEEDETTTLSTSPKNNPVREYFKRIFNWKLKDIYISDNENVKLDENTNIPRKMMIGSASTECSSCGDQL